MHQIIDNFLPQNEFEELEALVLRGPMPWFFCSGVSKPGDGNTYFIHDIYDNNAPQSEFATAFNPIFKRLEMDSLIRAKINLYPSFHKIMEHGYHSDQPYHHYGCIFYFNTCNGQTRLHDGTCVDSVANRALLLDTSMPHTSTNCDDAPVRITLNVNFFKGERNPNAAKC